MSGRARSAVSGTPISLRAPRRRCCRWSRAGCSSQSSVLPRIPRHRDVPPFRRDAQMIVSWVVTEPLNLCTPGLSFHDLGQPRRVAVLGEADEDRGDECDAVRKAQPPAPLLLRELMRQQEKKEHARQEGIPSAIINWQMATPDVEPEK